MADSARPTARLPFSGGRPPHLPCGPGDVAEDVLVPGDPDRVALLRNMLTDVQDFGRKREFALVTGIFEGRRLTICSSGIGGPSTEIALVELAMLGAKRVIRIGGCSALVPEIPTGDYIVPHMATGMTGVAALYAEHGHTPVADPALASALEASAAALGLGAHRGMIASTDSYYLGQDRPLTLDTAESPDAGYLDRFLAEGAIGVEMESQVILAVGRALGLRAACLLGVHGNRATDNWLVDYENTQRNLLRIAGRALAHDASQ